jgi:hypothetical protein
MYQFKPATQRIRKMRERIRDRVIRCDAERAVIITEASKKYENVVPIIKRPLMMRRSPKKLRRTSTTTSSSSAARGRISSQARPIPNGVR